MKRAVVYAVDDSARHALALLTSVRSVRRWSPIPVVVHAFAPLCVAFVERMHELGAEVVQREARPHLPRTALKWEALAATNVDECLFADTDTFFLRSPELLLDAGPMKGVLARKEVGTSSKRQWCGGTLMHPQIDQTQLRYIFEGLRVARIPIFNTGLMVMRGSVLAHMGSIVARIATFCRAFERDEIPYPSSNRHIMEEVAASLALAHVNDLSWGFLSPTVAPFYLEMRQAGSASVTAVHTWSAYYGQFLLEYVSHQAERTYSRVKRGSVHDEAFIRALETWSY